MMPGKCSGVSTKEPGKFIESSQEELLKQESDALESTMFRRMGSRPPLRGVKILRVGIKILFVEK
jgi:hypothetical protein